MNERNNKGTLSSLINLVKFYMMAKEAKDQISQNFLRSKIIETVMGITHIDESLFEDIKNLEPEAELMHQLCYGLLIAVNASAARQQPPQFPWMQPNFLYPAPPFVPPIQQQRPGQQIYPQPFNGMYPGQGTGRNPWENPVQFTANAPQTPNPIQQAVNPQVYPFIEAQKRAEKIIGEICSLAKLYQVNIDDVPSADVQSVITEGTKHEIAFAEGRYAEKANALRSRDISIKEISRLTPTELIGVARQLSETSKYFGHPLDEMAFEKAIRLLLALGYVERDRLRKEVEEKQEAAVAAERMRHLSENTPENGAEDEFPGTSEEHPAAVERDDAQLNKPEVPGLWQPTISTFDVK